jgi:hypothetical protein
MRRMGGPYQPGGGPPELLGTGERACTGPPAVLAVLAAVNAIFVARAAVTGSRRPLAGAASAPAAP